MIENSKEAPNKLIEIKRAIEEGNLVTTFTHIKRNSMDIGVAAVHKFRIEIKNIIESWSVHQEIPENSLNQNGVF